MSSSATAADRASIAALQTPSLALTSVRSGVPVVLGFVAAYILWKISVAAWMPGYYNKIIIDIGINIILAVSLTLVNGFTGQFSIGHAGFMAIGGYVSIIFTYYGAFLLIGHTGQIEGTLPGGLLFLTGCLAGGSVAGIAGYLVGLPSLRLRGDYLAIVTLGFGEIVRILFQQTGEVIYTAKDFHQASFWHIITGLGGSLGFSGAPKFTNVLWVYCFVTVMFLVAFRLKFSSFGRAFLSIREDEIAAEAMGVPLAKYKVRSFVMAGFFAGIAGALWAHELGNAIVPKDLGFMKSFDVVIMVVLGGMGSVTGAAFAAILLTILPELLRQFESYRMVFYSLSLILIMIVRPQGLFGIYEVWNLGPIRRWRDRRSRRKQAKEAPA